MTQKLKVGPAKYTGGGYVEFTVYPFNYEIAIRIYSEDGEPEATATVALEDAPNARSRNGVWLKGWSENEGLPEALELAGIVKLTGETHPTGFCEAIFAELTPEAIAQMEGR